MDHQPAKSELFIFHLLEQNLSMDDTPDEETYPFDTRQIAFYMIVASVLSVLIGYGKGVFSFE